MIKVKKLVPHALLPTKQRDSDIGYDLYCPDAVSLKPKVVTLVDLQIAIELPSFREPKYRKYDFSKLKEQQFLDKLKRKFRKYLSQSDYDFLEARGYYTDDVDSLGNIYYSASIRDRSGIATKQQIFVVAGVVDNSYRGSWKVAFYNSTSKTVKFEAGAKIAQFILVMNFNEEIHEVAELTETDRGNRGFGSSG